MANPALNQVNIYSLVDFLLQLFLLTDPTVLDFAHVEVHDFHCKDIFVLGTSQYSQ